MHQTIPFLPMHPLKLTPLPSMRPDDQPGQFAGGQDGFVDEAVVLALMAGPIPLRHTPPSGELVLTGDDMDYAGWCLKDALPAHAPEIARPLALETTPRRPAPPTLGEPGIGEPHSGSHRWWLAGFAGVLSTVVVTVLLHSLSIRTPAADEEVFSFRIPTQSNATRLPITEVPQTALELGFASEK